MKVIITGMHRSGTSMVAGLLKQCGLYLGENLISGHRDNPKGHFEDREFVRLNDRILAENGGRWDRPPEKISNISVGLQKDIKQFIKKWPQNKLVGWKDPRACITLPVWRKALKEEGLKIVIVRRFWLEIVKSLEVRNGFSHEKSIDLIRVYLGQLEKNIINIGYVTTYYLNYFDDWKSELRKVCKFLGLKTRYKDSIGEFIDKKLWHHRDSNEQK